MKGVRFYEEFTNTRKRVSEGNCLAVFPDLVCPDGSCEAIGAVYYWPDSGVASTAASWKWLRKRCKRVSEAKARQIHPQLFRRLEDTV